MTGALRPFRFGVVAPVMTDMSAWRDGVRRIADQGCATVLVADVPGWQPSPTRKDPSSSAPQWRSSRGRT